ncbi:MAG: hypothetical protein DRG30_10365, partial [Epsilonproteobacteria bacterium]
RTDDHLLYGFYTVEKKSGYRALHCDHTLFNPRFDASLSDPNDKLSLDPNAIFALSDPQDNAIDRLRKFYGYFNIEIQIHTSFENLWASMEHTSSYNIQAKGRGRNSEITVQWKFLSDAMKNLEEQFERLQVDTEKAHFQMSHNGGYIPVKKLLDKLQPDIYPIYLASTKRVEDLEDLLDSHEISRQDYVHQLQAEIGYTDDFATKQSDLTLQMLFRIQNAFVYYGLANQSKYFNSDDIRQFIKESLFRYKEISAFLSSHSEIYMGNLFHIIVIIRYLYLGQKYGLGLMNPPEEIFRDDDTPAVRYASSLSFFEKGIFLLNRLKDEELNLFTNDSVISIEILHQYDVQAREWELFNTEYDSLQSASIVKNIAQFRAQFINSALQDRFNRLLESNEIKNVEFIVKFYTTMVWHGLLRPIDALKQIVKYSAHDKIKASDLFYYELSAYKFLLIEHCETISDYNKALTEHTRDPARTKHFRHYHRKNMIQLLFRIKRSESTYKFQKARLSFEQLTKSKFKVDYFSDTLSHEDAS